MPVAVTRVGAATNQADDTMRAVNARVFHNGDGRYDGVEGKAATIILSDGFESGDGTTWRN